MKWGIIMEMIQKTKPIIEEAILQKRRLKLLRKISQAVGLEALFEKLRNCLLSDNDWASLCTNNGHLIDLSFLEYKPNKVVLGDSDYYFIKDDYFISQMWKTCSLKMARNSLDNEYEARLTPKVFKDKFVYNENKILQLKCRYIACMVQAVSDLSCFSLIVRYITLNEDITAYLKGQDSIIQFKPQETTLTQAEYNFIIKHDKDDFFKNRVLPLVHVVFPERKELSEEDLLLGNDLEIVFFPRKIKEQIEVLANLVTFFEKIEINHLLANIKGIEPDEPLNILKKAASVIIRKIYFDRFEDKLQTEEYQKYHQAGKFYKVKVAFYTGGSRVVLTAGEFNAIKNLVLFKELLLYAIVYKPSNDYYYLYPKGLK